MACCLASVTDTMEENREDRVLIEAKTFQQARERTFLLWPPKSHPCRMKMKEAGWFIVRNTHDELVAVCLYCKKTYKGWNHQHDPYNVHKILSPTCVFVLYAQNNQTPSSPIIEFIPRRKEVRPSSHKMAELPKRTKSYEQWPYRSPHPSPDVLAEAGLFYKGQNTRVQCFFCHGEISIFRRDENPMLAHTNQCKYAKHLRGHPQRASLNIRVSEKVYELDDVTVNNITFYFLRCLNALTPGILLSTLIHPPNEQELETSDKILKQLRPSEQLRQRVNWATSSDGPLVNILKYLAHNPEDLIKIPDDQRCLIENSSILSTDPTNNLIFQCKTCLNNDASPHIVPIKCCHLGLCLKCFSKWMTCVICSYTIGKAIRIYGV